MKARIHPEEICIFSLNIVTNLPKLWIEPTKFGHIFRKQSSLKIKHLKKSIKIGLLVQYSSKKIFLERLFRCSRNMFIILISLTLTLFSEKILFPLYRCIHGFEANLNKKSATVSILGLLKDKAIAICTSPWRAMAY